MPDFDPNSVADSLGAPPSPNDVADAIMQAHAPDDTGKKFQRALDFYKKRAETYWGPGSDSYAVERVPVAGALDQVFRGIDLYNSAKAIQEGTHTDQDIYRVAQEVAKHQYEAGRGVGQKTVDLLGQLPAMISEWAMSGGVGGAAKKAVADLGTKALGTSLPARAATAVGKTAAEGVARSALMPSTYANMAQYAVQPDEQGMLQPVPPHEAVLKGAAASAIQNTIFAASGMFAPKQAGNWFKDAAWSTAKAIGGVELSREAIYRMGISGEPSAAWRALSSDDKMKAIQELAPELIVFGGLEGIMHALPAMANRSRQLQQQGVQPGSPAMQKAVSEAINWQEVGTKPPYEPPEPGQGPVPPQTTPPQAPQAPTSLPPAQPSVLNEQAIQAAIRRFPGLKESEIRGVFALSGQEANENMKAHADDVQFLLSQGRTISDPALQRAQGLASLSAWVEEARAQEAPATAPAAPPSPSPPPGGPPATPGPEVAPTTQPAPILQAPEAPPTPPKTPQEILADKYDQAQQFFNRRRSMGDGKKKAIATTRRNFPSLGEWNPGDRPPAPEVETPPALPPQPTGAPGERFNPDLDAMFGSETPPEPVATRSLRENPDLDEMLGMPSRPEQGLPPLPPAKPEAAPAPPQAAPEPVPPEQAPAPAGPTRRHITTDSKEYILDRIDRGEGGLTEQEKRILTERLLWATGFRELAKQEGVKGQTIKNWEKAALDKLGYSGTVDEFHLGNRGNQAIADVEDGKMIGADQLHQVDPEGALHNARINQIADAVDALNALHQKRQKLLGQGRKITPEQEAKDNAEFERLRRIIDEGHAEAGAAPSQPGAAPSTRPGETPVRPDLALGLPRGQGAEAQPAPEATPGPPQGNAETPAAAAPGGQAGRDVVTPPGAAVAPPRPVQENPVDRALKQIVAEQAQMHQEGTAGFAGGLGVRLADSLYNHLAGAVGAMKTAYREMAGEMFPKTSDLANAVGEALARFVSVPTYAKLASARMIDKVLGPNVTEAEARILGTAFQEMRHRHARANGSAPQAATFIGQQNSPLKTEADYQQVINSRRFRDVMDAWKREMVPLMEENFRGAQGLDPTDPINSPTQIPGLPMNAKAIRDEGAITPSTVFMGGGRGRLKNMKIGKLPFAEQAALNAPAYDTDLRTIIENSIAEGSKAARKAEFYRIGEEEGVLRWAKPGQQIDGWKELEFTRPPRGTQTAQPGEVAYARENIYPEVRRAMGPDWGYQIPVVSSVLNGVTKAALLSTVEAAYHSKNLATMMAKPGMSPVDLVKNAIDVIRNTPESQDRVVELARIGAMKEKGFEAGMLWGGMTDPTAWMSKFLDVADRTMRLTAEDAFNRLERQGRVVGSETNKRNFINQLGQYNKRAQNQLVVALRDTGIGPFATAGTNYYIQGLRALLGGAGAEATNAKAAVGLRAEALARTLGILGGTALANYFMWGRADGDDNTPIGALKVGDNQQGRTAYLDFTNMTGLSRGAREVGLLSLLEGQRKGTDEQKIARQAENSAFRAIAHPAMGPGVQFFHTLRTGENDMGQQIATTRKGPYPNPTLGERAVAAVKQANPVYSALSGAYEPKKEVPLEERIMKLLGPYGLQYRSTPPAKSTQQYKVVPVQPSGSSHGQSSAGRRKR